MDHAPVTRPASFVAQAARVNTRASDLERRSAVEMPKITSQPSFIFSAHGTLVTGDVSGRHRYANPTVMKLIVCDLEESVGTTATVLDFYLTGSATSFQTVTIAAGSDNEAVEVGVYYGGFFDYVTMKITTAGTGAAGLSAHIFTTI